MYAASLSGYKYFLIIRYRKFGIIILSFFIQRRNSEYVHQEYSFFTQNPSELFTLKYEGEMND